MMRRLALLAPLALAACAAISAEEKALLTEPVDCARAPAQIAALQQARPGDLRKARVLATSLTPVGFASGVAMNDFGDRERVLGGAHEAQIEARIALIEETCSP